MGAVVLDEVPEIATTTNMLRATTTDHGTTDRTEPTRTSRPRLPTAIDTLPPTARRSGTNRKTTLFSTRDSGLPGLDQRAIPGDSETQTPQFIELFLRARDPSRIRERHHRITFALGGDIPMSLRAIEEDGLTLQVQRGKAFQLELTASELSDDNHRR
jgi:hypothetical protein